ncbi:hypothetical protein KC669_02195, partial [Candidatus Dojkabacteria bacterium]|nr:hypothetical protein [Candidatus Dojkabacteria bacterium]
FDSAVNNFTELIKIESAYLEFKNRINCNNSALIMFDGKNWVKLVINNELKLENLEFLENSVEVKVKYD